MLPKPIVVGVDQSPEALRAAELASRIAAAAGAALIPVHAVPVAPVINEAIGVVSSPIYSPDLQDQIARASRAELARVLGRVLPAAALRQLDVQTGPPAFVLAEVARKRRAQLIVLGAKAHGALARGLGRSTAHYLLRTLDVPVLVASSAAPIARVLAAVDLSAASLPTVRAAQAFAKLLGARLRLLHVVEPLPQAYPMIGLADGSAYRRRSQEAFDAFVASLGGAVDHVLLEGHGVDAIAGEATAWHADLVVVGSHGKGWVDRVLLGSTTERLVTALPTSVMVICVRPTAFRAPRRSQAAKRRARAT